MVMNTTEKVREDRLREAAKRQGFAIVKSRRRDLRARDYGCYAIENPYNNTWEAGVTGSGYSMNLDEVEQWLTS
jgi:hypothetical protein